MATAAAGACAENADELSEEAGQELSAEQQAFIGGSTGTLLAHVTHGGSSLSLYEPEPGTVVEVEHGSAGAAPIVGTELSFSQRFERISGKQAPAALLAAEKRAGAEAPAPTLYKGVYPPSGDGHVHGEAPSESWFIEAYCRDQDRFLGGVNRTGGEVFVANDLAYWRAGVYVKQGNIVYEWIHNGQGGSEGMIALNAGEYAALRVKTKLNRGARSWVKAADERDAQGKHIDLYHHCVNFHY